MGILFYDIPSNNQLLRDSAFSSDFGNFWTASLAELSVEYAAFPELSNSINKYRGALLISNGAFISQEGAFLIVSGTQTLSLLASSDSSSEIASLTLSYEVLKESLIMFSYSKQVFNFTSDFNNKFITMRIPPIPGATSGRVTIRLNGETSIKISNPKFSGGQSPCRWSPFPGETVINVPSSFSVPTPNIKDPLDSSVDKVFPGLNQKQPAGTFGTSIGGSVRQIGAGEPTAGVDFSGLFEEYDDFYKEERTLLEKDRQSQVNKEDQAYYPKESGLATLKFERKKLKEHLDKIDGTTSRSRAFVSWAKSKLAGYRRAYEMRMHSRLDFYAFAFIENWMAYQSLPEERELIHKGAGDG